MTTPRTSDRAHLIANAKSGKGKGQTIKDDARVLCEELGVELITYDTKSADDFERQSARAVAAAEVDGGVVIAAGGDGTIRGVAQAAVGRKVRFAVIPIGTFNFFARGHQIPEDHLAALRLALTGDARPVRLGDVNGHVFLINASLGLYAKAIAEREERTSRFGRNRLVVIISTMMSLLSDHRILDVALLRDGQSTRHRTPMLFMGNNGLQLRNLEMNVADCMKQNKLAAVLMKPVTRMETLRIIFRGLTKTLSTEGRLDTFCVDEMIVRTIKSHHKVALDGEVIRMTSPFTIKARPDALNLIKPTAPLS